MSILVIQFVFGLIILYVGAEFFIKGASDLAVVLKVTPLLIGLLVVSLGTSAPEFLVSLMAAIKNNDDISIGNIIGSNIFNLLFVIGTVSLIHPFQITSEMLAIHMPVMLLFSIILIPIFISNLVVTRKEGMLLIAAYFAYIYYIAASNV